MSNEEAKPNFCGLYADAMTEVVHADNPTDAWAKLTGLRGTARLIEVSRYLPDARLIKAAPSN
jgi:hypothetical protein